MCRLAGILVLLVLPLVEIPRFKVVRVDLVHVEVPLSACLAFPVAVRLLVHARHNDPSSVYVLKPCVSGGQEVV